MSPDQAAERDLGLYFWGIVSCPLATFPIFLLARDERGSLSSFLFHITDPCEAKDKAVEEGKLMYRSGAFAALAIAHGANAPVAIDEKLAVGLYVQPQRWLRLPSGKDNRRQFSCASPLPRYTLPASLQGEAAPAS